ncbi:hypothetical protein GCM10018780_52440 [Streptomyces lanatus]|nr:hypothetical protein GCM10018780_52440 [Streptomyces lanatus]
MGIGRIALPIAEGHDALVFLGSQSVRERQLISEQPHGRSPAAVRTPGFSMGVDGDRAKVRAERIAPYQGYWPVVTDCQVGGQVPTLTHPR